METILAALLAPDLAALAGRIVRLATWPACATRFSIPGTALASAGLAALAGWIYDRHV